MQESADGGDFRPATHGFGQKKLPKHRNKLPAWDGPVPMGDEENVRGLPAIMGHGHGRGKS